MRIFYTGYWFGRLIVNIEFSSAVPVFYKSHYSTILKCPSILKNAAQFFVSVPVFYNIKEATKTIRENRKRKQELKQEYEALNEQCDHLLARLRKLKSDFTKFKSEVMETMILF